MIEFLFEAPGVSRFANKRCLLPRCDANNKAIDADAALQELGSDQIGEAFVTAIVTIWDNNPRIADEKLRLVEKVIQGRDFTCITETVNAVEAWLGSLPGHVYANVRQPPISTLNLAHIVPLSAVWAGEVRDHHFEAPPLLSGKTDGSTPFRFSLHVGDVGHTLIIGPTGAGKSVLLAMMALQFLRYPGAQIFAFDFSASIRAAAIAMGGDWHDLGGALAGESSEFVALQPLAKIDEVSERGWAADWIASILARERVEVTPEVKEHIWSALTSLASAPPLERTLTGLSVLLRPTWSSGRCSPIVWAVIANAQTRWQNAVADLQDPMRVQATVVANLDTNHTQMSALVSASPAGKPSRQSAPCASKPAARGSHRGNGRAGTCSDLGAGGASGRPGPGQGAAQALPEPGQATTNPQQCKCSINVGEQI